MDVSDELDVKINSANLDEYVTGSETNDRTIYDRFRVAYCVLRFKEILIGLIDYFVMICTSNLISY